MRHAFGNVRRIAAALLLLVCAWGARAQGTAGYSEYYLPGDELNMYYIFNNLDANGTGNTGMHSVTSVVAWSASTTVYYDHWENGYGFDPANPGSTADETVILAAQGDLQTFESSNVPSGGPPPAGRNPAATCPGQGNPGDRCYDGGDRLYVAGGPVTVTRAVWMEARGAGNQGDAWEVYPVQPQLTTYVMPFGENNYATSATFFTGFERVFALIQATAPNTVVSVDLDANGTNDMLNLNRDAVRGNAGDATSVTLQTGQTFLLDRISACTAGANCTTFPGGGTLNSGVVITGSETLQVKFVAGRTGTTYAARGLSAFPRGFWTEDYYAPFGESAAAGRHTDYYLFNPHATPLTINWQSQTGAGSFVVPANSTESYNRALGANPSVPLAQGLYFSASQPFWGVGFGDSTGQAFEWGYSLLPTSFLYDEHYMGWSPGSLPLGSAPVNGNSVFLTVAQDNTVVFVDYQNDGIADATNTLDRLEQWFVPPGPTGDLAGARFWATGQFSMAWGENADTATTPTPNLDLGYVALPGTDFISLALTVEKTANPTVVAAAAGSTTQFRLSTKSKQYSMNNVSVVDTLPPNWQYVAGSASVTFPNLTTSTVNPTITGTGSAANPFVLTWSGLGNMGANQEILITFTAQTMSAFATGTLSQNRVTSTGTRTVGTPSVTQTFVATDFAYVVTGNVQITKTSNAPTPLYPGDAFTYTVTVTNPAAAGTNLLTGVSLYDAIPSGLTGVAGTTSLNRSSVADSFNSASFALNTGTRNWAGNWAENDAAGAGTGAGDIQVTGGELRIDNSNSNEPTISRAVATTGATANNVRLSFRYRTDTGVDAGDGMLVLAGNAGTGGAFGTTLATITGITGASTATVSFDIPAGLIGANTAIRFQPTANTYTGGTEFFYVDDISITYNVAVTGPNPPDLLSTTTLYALVGGQSLTATFNVTVDNPFPNVSPTLTNTAATTSVQIPLQLTASATNTVTTPTLLSSTVAGRLWIDANANGAQDVGEGGIDNVVVTLKDSFGTPIATATTDSNGRYLFTGVTPGNGYYVEATAPPNPGGYPAGLTQSFPVGFANDRSSTFDLSAGENYTQANLGYRATDTTAIFGDFAWIDADGDQVRDAGEIGITGITLTLYRDANGNGILEPGTDTLVTTATTTPDGSYLITGITPGASGTDVYFVSAATPAGYSATTPTSVRFTNVQQGGSYVSADFGYLPTGASFSITDRVWYDANGNGLFSGEVGIAGVTVELLDATQNVIGTTTTAADGTFTFTGLPGGGADYTTRINDTSNVLADYYGTTTFATARQRLESNLNANVNRAAAPSYGFNFTRSIGDTVWNDLDGDGTRDAGEPGFAGVTVTLYNDVNGNGVINVGDTAVGTVVTDTNGQYLFTGVANGNYIVSVPAQTGYNYIAGGRPDTDGAAAGIQLAANVAGGANVLTRDFGFQAATPRTVSGRVWNDTNQNGTVNAGETGFAGVTVEVLSVIAGAGTISATAGSNTITGTGTNFTLLNPGDPILINGVAYIVQNVASNTSLTLTKLYTNATSSGLAWSRPNTVLQTTTTNASGDYTFSGLASATHIVRLSDAAASLTGYGSTFEVTEGLVTAGNPANFVENVNLAAGNAANVNFGYVQLGIIPTLIELRSFDAVQNRTKVRLTWQTAMETNNLGFNVYRDVRGQRTKVNDKLIAGSAFLSKRNAVAGYSYRLRDTLPSSEAFVQYWLEDVDTAGERTLHGPFTPAGTSDESLGDHDDETESNSAPLGGLGADGSAVANAPGFGIVRPAVLTVPTAAQTTRQLELAGETALKVFVAREGWHRVTRAQMAAAGFDVRPDKAGVYCEGIEVPVVATADAIEFYGVDNDTPSTGARTYWIRSKDKGLDLPLSPAGGGASHSDSVPFVYQRIDRSVWVPNFVDTGDGENFFGPIVTTTPVSQELILGSVDDAAPADARLELTFRGGTEDVDHQIRVELNGQYVGDTSLRSLELRTVRWDLPHSWLLPGANQLTLTALNGDLDVSVLVSTRLTYRHHLAAQDGLLTADFPSSREITVTGFPDGEVRALDITNPLAPVAIEVAVTPTAEGSFHATFTTPAGNRNRTIAVFSSNQIHTDAELALSTPSTLVSGKKNRAADMVIVTHPNFRSAADALAQKRSAEKMITVVVDVDDVYDEYNFGVRSPQAIRAFLQDAQTWRKAPTHVLLVGDASIDPRGYLGLGLVDFIPTKLVPTAYLKTASDGWFADFGGTGVEDMAIGRLPVRTPEAAAVVVGKLTSRGTPSGAWANKAVMIADEPETWNFAGTVAALRSLLPPAIGSSATTIDIGSTPSPRDAVLDAMNAGSLFVDYFGHGSVGLWNQNVLTDTDAAELQNGSRLPFVASMTCLNAYFHDLFTASLAESLLTAPDGGAIAVWSSSGLTEPGPQVAMNQELLRHIFSGTTTIGQAIRKAKLATSSPDVRRSWNLLGDPSMKLTQ